MSEQQVTPATSEDPFLKIDRVAAIFDVTTHTIRQWIKDDKIHATKIQNRWRIRQSEVNRVANQEYGS